jgi:hypothetical protein
MKYKNLNLAYLFEIIIGFGCIMSIAVLGQNGLATLGLIVIRPFILDKEQIKDEKTYYTFSYKVLSSSIVIVAMLIIAIFIILNFIPHLIPKLPPRDKILFLLLPFFLMTHGVVGFMYNQKK